ncbi:hypothetical protein AAKU52_001875 [Pedobacter sp. CG_S7]|uniref:hypothetical protein n=1 Tax=Pedobacter sp. CG_S7 TaxID=3143930 RepID=UPI0033928183
MMKYKHLIKGCLILAAIGIAFKSDSNWASKFLTISTNGIITYYPDEKGNTIPDFSQVGYHHGNKEIPEVKVVKTVSPVDGDARELLQKAIDEVSALKPDINGFRGTILIKKGEYLVTGSLKIATDGIVLRGEGNDEHGTRLIADGKGARSLIQVSGKGKLFEIPNTKMIISDNYVPTGAKSFHVNSSKTSFKPGDKIILSLKVNEKWIQDLQMDQIITRNGTKQWEAKDYILNYEREITAVKGNKITIDNPVVMAIDKQYGGAEIYRYEYNGRLKEIGIENILFKSAYTSAIDEDHGWVAVNFNHIENGWIRNITSKYFGFACVSLESGAKNITVKDAKCLDAKSIITGGRRYSFNNNGQQNLFMNLESTEARHDFVTGAKTCGPNVFYNGKARNTHADIGPHHRWASGTLFDNIDTDGEINIQDRGNWGSGHGWSGVTQVLWNCNVEGAAVQNPWVSGKNYAIGLKGKKLEGRLKGKPEGEWEGLNKPGLYPSSLYMAQLIARKAQNK